MLEVAQMGWHVAQMTSQKGIRQCFDAVTVKQTQAPCCQRCADAACGGNIGPSFEIDVESQNGRQKLTCSRHA
jgi:hypothetical protein